LASLRMAVSQLLSAHFVHEDAHMANVLWASCNKSTKTLNDWVEMRQDIRNGYSEHIRNWPLSEVLHWRDYRRAVAARLKAGNALMCWEEDEIYGPAI
jgi:hypothetical protein